MGTNYNQNTFFIYLTLFFAYMIFLHKIVMKNFQAAKTTACGMRHFMM